jgi:endo-1,4-beta-xylanase
MHKMKKWAQFLAGCLIILGCRSAGTDKGSMDDEAAVYDFEWIAKNPILDARMFDEEEWIAIKDPSIVRYDGKWHLFCTLRGRVRSHATVYTSFETFEEAKDVKPVILSNHEGYFCAPQVFYFTPHEKWYMICQAKSEKWEPDQFQCAFATSDDISDPDSWTALESTGIQRPPNDRFLDFWVICDDEKVYAFYTCDDGDMYRVETSYDKFPYGWTPPVLAYRGDIFEASHIYWLPDQEKFVNLIEAQGKEDRRYFKAYLADSLNGEWTPAPSDEIGTYAGPDNVYQIDGAWTNGISHGELIRNGFDERMEASLENPFIYQGVLHRNRAGKAYGDIQWRLGLLEPRHSYESIGYHREAPPLHASALYPVGVSIGLDMLRNDTVMDIAGYEFNSLTAENYMKMHHIIQEDFSYDFEAADEYLEFAGQKDMRMFGHALLWHHSTPGFIQQMEGDQSRLYQFTREYIHEVVSRYKGRVDAWDVVNEALVDKTGGMRDNVWHKTLGEDYLELAFRTAHAADPNAKLFLNDYDIEKDSAKLEGFLRLVYRLIEKGVPIHGIGMQLHLSMEVPDEVIAESLKRCVETGLMIHISELDIVFNKKGSSRGGGIQIYDELTSEMEQQQAEKFRQIALMYNEIVPKDQRYGITLWGFSDRFSWIRYYYNIMDWPLIFDDELNKKPSYAGLREGLEE